MNRNEKQDLKKVLIIGIGLKRLSVITRQLRNVGMKFHFYFALTSADVDRICAENRDIRLVVMAGELTDKPHRVRVPNTRELIEEIQIKLGHGKKGRIKLIAALARTEENVEMREAGCHEEANSDQELIDFLTAFLGQ